MEEPLLTMKDLISRVGGNLTPRMVRYYHQIGLMPVPQRSRGNYRLYSQADVQRLRQIGLLKQQGFQLAHVQQLLGDQASDSKSMLIQLQNHYQVVVQKIAHLRQTAHALEGILGRDHACKSIQTDLLVQLQGSVERNPDTLDDLTSFWEGWHQTLPAHPESFQESLQQLLPDLSQRSEIEIDLIQKLVLACGDVSIVPMMQISLGVIATARHHLSLGCDIITDTQMVAAALDQARLSHLGCKIRAIINDPHIASVQDAEQNFWQDPQRKAKLMQLADGAIVVIGYAPSILLNLCELVREKKCKPSLIIGLPVGFSHAPAAKRYLMHLDIPQITISGSQGGGLLAATALNALAASLIEKPDCHCYQNQAHR
ncbi:MAG: MerR family transcriptional regulator [Synechococcaceae cyanobacterium SM2_3_1]|nr:MerR family transcriptional regulator [Synechococcaceae cyanobacterium SM2_3_1]